MEQVTILRANRRYQRAARLIAQLLEAPLESQAAEVLSFERGELLEKKLAAPGEACRHWRAHQRRFGPGRYGPQVDAYLQACEQSGR